MKPELKFDNFSPFGNDTTPSWSNARKEHKACVSILSIPSKMHKDPSLAAFIKGLSLQIVFPFSSVILR